MKPWLLVRLGAPPRADGVGGMYALLDDDQVKDVIAAANDDEALAKARAVAPQDAVECEEGLAAVAQRRNSTTRPLTTFEKIIKAHLAAPQFAKETYGLIKSGEVLMDVFEAAYVFQWGAVKDPRPQWHIAATLRGTVAETSLDRDLFLLVEPGPQPKLFVLSRADATWVFANDAEVTAVDRMLVEWRPEPAELVAILEEAYGLTGVPHVTIVENRVQRPPDEVTMEVLACCLGGMGRHMNAKSVGIFYTPQLGGELDFKLKTYTPDP